MSRMTLRIDILSLLHDDVAKAGSRHILQACCHVVLM